MLLSGSAIWWIEVRNSKGQKIGFCGKNKKYLLLVMLKNESRFQNTAFLSNQHLNLDSFLLFTQCHDKKKILFRPVGNLHMIWKTHFIICFAGHPAACGSIFMSAFQSEGKRSPVSNYSGHYQRPTNFAQPTQQRIHQKCGRQGFLCLSGRRDSNTRHPMEKGKKFYF